MLPEVQRDYSGLFPPLGSRDLWRPFAQQFEQSADTRGTLLTSTLALPLVRIRLPKLTESGDFFWGTAHLAQLSQGFFWLPLVPSCFQCNKKTSERGPWEITDPSRFGLNIVQAGSEVRRPEPLLQKETASGSIVMKL